MTRELCLYAFTSVPCLFGNTECCALRPMGLTLRCVDRTA